MIVDCAVYADGRRQGGSLPLEEAYEAARSDGGFVWVALQEPGEDEFASLREELHLHPLAVEDAVHAHQRPKLDRYGDTALLVLKPVTLHGARQELGFGELLVFLGPGFVLSVRHGDAVDMAAVRQALEAHPGHLRLGASAVVHAIVDHVVDAYAPVIAALEEEVEDIEEEVFSPARTDASARVYRAQRQTIDLYRAVAPLETPLDALAGDEDLGVPLRVRSYFRDAHDHVVRDRDRLDTLRELLNNVLEVNLTQVTVRQNEDMRKITAWAAIAAAPTVIASIYGMNFEHMPELDSPLGYPLAILGMALISFALYRWFRRIGWL